MQISKYNYNDRLITATCIDDTDTYLFLAFDLLDGYCNLKKVSINNPLQFYHNIDIATNKIIKMVSNSQYLYIALDDNNYIGQRRIISNPASIATNYTIPGGILEKPVDIIVDNTYVYFLLPGNLSGTNAKILRYLKGTSVINQIINLNFVTNAISFVLDTNNEIWVITYTSPSTLIRVFNLSTIPEIEITEII